ncbi:MAG TPA: hypothetical protein QF604_09090 [Candidatus Latescibacteria bacterium]|jgi:hypothetical protein|nr:hypothetical protein [Gemmatimonadota bacterium]MDP7363265.1 hypothetical protein [Candidatus Latescibacterota bacterium]HCV24182.1 hypothetical protein [Candidatus Latescibacterota bacterium]HJN28059.1 hypothetical protein [Candidatus Latescibacterota bacterium]
MTLAVRATDQGPIPEAIHKQLWECVSARLQRGDSLIRPLDFQRALEADYTALTGVSISESVRRWLAHAQVTSNRENPDRYVARDLSRIPQTSASPEPTAVPPGGLGNFAT